MYFNFDKEKLPEIYIRDNRRYYLDPIRKKLILITPEETVRQKWISFIKNTMNIAERLISVETHLSHYGAQSKRRADIIIHGNDDSGNIYPLCIVECKAPDVPISENTHEQIFDYCNEIEADYAVMSNGYDTICYKYDEEKNCYFRLTEIPSFEELSDGMYSEYDWGKYPERTPFSEFEKALENSSGECFISEDTPREKALAALIFWNVFLIIV